MSEKQIINNFGVQFICCSKAIVYKYDLATACLYGLIWSFCQMSKGLCWASEANLGKILGYTRQTISIKKTNLEKAGLITEVSKIRYKNGGVTLKLRCNHDVLLKLEKEVLEEIKKLEEDDIEGQDSDLPEFRTGSSGLYSPRT